MFGIPVKNNWACHGYTPSTSKYSRHIPVQITAVSKLLKAKTTFNTENYRHLNVACHQKSGVTNQAFKRCAQKFQLQFKYPTGDIFFQASSCVRENQTFFHEVTYILPPSRRIFLCRECWGLPTWRVELRINFCPPTPKYWFDSLGYIQHLFFELLNGMNN